MRTLIVLLIPISIAQAYLIGLVRHIEELSPYCATAFFDHSFGIFEGSHSWSYFCSKSSRNMFGSRDIWRDHLKILAGSFDEFDIHLNILGVTQVTNHIFFFAINCDDLAFYRIL